MIYNKKLAKLAPNITMTPAPTLQVSTNNNGFRSNVPSIPLLILNSVQQQNQDKDSNSLPSSVTNDKGKKTIEILTD